MSVSFGLPGILRPLAEGAARVDVDGAPETVGEALAALRRRCPGVYDRIVTEAGELRPHVNLFVGDTEIRRTGGFDTPLTGESEILVIPAVSGG